MQVRQLINSESMLQETLCELLANSEATLNMNADIIVLPIFSTKSMKQKSSLLEKWVSDGEVGHWSIVILHFSNKAIYKVDSLGPDNAYFCAIALESFATKLMAEINRIRSNPIGWEILIDTIPIDSKYFLSAFYRSIDVIEVITIFD